MGVIEGVDGVLGAEGADGVLGATGAMYCAMVILIVDVVVTPKASVIVTSKVKVPCPDGVPEISPLVGLSERPLGRAPDVIA
jgi:hypothetical protein